MIVRLSRCGAARPLAGSELANQLVDRGGVVTRRDAGFDREWFEFLVVHEGDRRFAFHYLCELRRGGAGVAIENVDPELGECAGGVEEETVVPAQHADHVALANPLRGERPGERVGAFVELGERQPPVVVDDCDAIRVASARGTVQPGQARAPVAIGADHARANGRAGSDAGSPNAPGRARCAPTR